MRRSDSPDLTRRESQIMQILHRRKEATAAEVQGDLPDPPGYSSVRKLLEILEKKGCVTHRSDGPRYVFAPATAPVEARKSALKNVMSTFFAGSVEDTVLALLDMSEKPLSKEKLDRIAKLADRAKRKGK